MKKIQVGSDFKLPMFGLKGECIFSKDTGYLYFEDDNVIRRLNLEEHKVINLQVEERTILLEKDKESDTKFSKFELRLNDQRRSIEDLATQVQEKEKCIGVIQGKLDVVGKELLQLKGIFKDVSSIMEETVDDQKQILNIFDTDTTLKQIWDNYTNKNSAALFSILMLMKKYLEDKGVRVQ